LRCGDLTKKRPRLRQVLTYGELDTGKTSGSTRPIRVPDLLLHDLEYYLSELSKAAFPTGPDDWLFPGNLSGRGHGHPAGHMTGSQAHKWGPRYFTKTADIAWSFSGDKLGDFSKATQYSLRRGGISLRLRAGEDRQVIADECGTSVQMIDQHYSHVLGLLRDEGPLSADEERLKARVAEFRVSHPEQVPA
jgi:hypothetical protein